MLGNVGGYIFLNSKTFVNRTWPMGAILVLFGCRNG